MQDSPDEKERIKIKTGKARFHPSWRDGSGIQTWRANAGPLVASAGTSAGSNLSQQQVAAGSRYLACPRGTCVVTVRGGPATLVNLALKLLDLVYFWCIVGFVHIN